MSQAHDLSHIQYNGRGDHSASSFIIVVSRWNDQVTNALYEGARSTLLKAGVKSENIIRYDVPGSFELPLGAQFALDSRDDLTGVICLGCVVQGETRHFEFINHAVAQGVTRVSLDYSKPVIFGVLTPDTMEQALARAGGKLGNKGEEAAVAALEMADLSRCAYGE